MLVALAARFKPCHNHCRDRCQNQTVRRLSTGQRGTHALSRLNLPVVEFKRITQRMYFMVTIQQLF